MNVKKLFFFISLIAMLISIPAISQTNWMGFTHDKPVASKSLKSSDLADVITASDTGYCLMVDSDVVLDSDVACIDISASANVDLNGYTVDGSVLSFSSSSSVTIKNGAIDGGAIIFFGGDHVIDNVTLQNSTAPFAVQINSGRIVNSRFENNSVAIDLFVGNGIEVRNNYFSGNVLAINIASDNDSIVEGNIFVENDIGVRLFDEDFSGVNGNLISRNYFLRNDVGVFMRAFNEANDNEITANIFIENKSSGIVAGIGCFQLFIDECAGRGTIINRNFALRNGQDPRNVSGTWFLSSGDDEGEAYEFLADSGITVFGAQTINTTDGVSMSRNQALLNAGLGIDAEGVVDDGRNFGILNGDYRQCSGVNC